MVDVGAARHHGVDQREDLAPGPGTTDTSTETNSAIDETLEIEPNDQRRHQQQPGIDYQVGLVEDHELGWNASQRPRDLGVRSGRGEAPPVLSERRGVSAIRQGRALCGGAERDGVSEGLKSLHEASDLDLGVAM